METMQKSKIKEATRGSAVFVASKLENRHHSNALMIINNLYIAGDRRRQVPLLTEFLFLDSSTLCCNGCLLHHIALSMLPQ